MGLFLAAHGVVRVCPDPRAASPERFVRRPSRYRSAGRSRNSMAFSTCLNEFIFFSSVRVPKACPGRAAPIHWRRSGSCLPPYCRRRFPDTAEWSAVLRYAPASSGARISGSLTISISGTPVRFRSTRLTGLIRLMHEFARVFLHMNARDADALFCVRSIQYQYTRRWQWAARTGKSDTLWEDRDKNNFSGQTAFRRNPAMRGKGHSQGKFDHFPV